MSTMWEAAGDAIGQLASENEQLRNELNDVLAQIEALKAEILQLQQALLELGES